MKLRSFALIIALCAIFSFSTASSAKAEVSIAVVDVESLMTDSAAAKSIKQQMETRAKALETEMQAVEKQLREDFEKIKKESEKLSKEENEKKSQEFFKKRAEAQKSLKEKATVLRKSEGKALQKLTDAVFDVCAKLAEERKYDLVITRGNVIVGSKALDITADVMKNLDASLPTVKVADK